MTTRRRKERQEVALDTAMCVTLILVAFIAAIGCMYDARLDSALTLFAVGCFIGAYCVWEQE